MRTPPTYYAITAVDQTSWYTRQGEQRFGLNWYIVAGPCPAPGEAELQGQNAIGPIYNEYQMADIYRETAHKNVHVVSKSRLNSYRIFLEAAP